MDKEHSSDTFLRYSDESDQTHNCCDHDESCEDSDEDEWLCQSCGIETEEGYDFCLDCEDAEEDDEYPWDKETL
jgi:hypothetical protein